MTDQIKKRQMQATADDDQSLGQIREILLKDDRRQTSQQIASIEARLDDQDIALRQLLDQRINQALEDLRGEIDTLGLRQQDALDGLDNVISQTLKEQAAALGRLASDKVDRTQLATLLEAMAQQLRDSTD